MNIIDKIIIKLMKWRKLDSRQDLKTLKAIINALPDMLWAKASDGSYLYANEAIIEKLLFTGSLKNTIGRKDGEISQERIAAIGKENHTFGIVCGNSDYVVLDKEVPEKFLEFGLVTGEPMYLEVHKDVLRDEEGNIIGTVGTGRDLTKEYLALKELSDNISKMSKKEIKQELIKLINIHWYAA